MPKAKPFTKHQILEAMDKTKSVRAASRYLNCSYQHLKAWMKKYTDDVTGETLFDTHKNPHGFGIPKFVSHKPFNRKEPAIIDIIEGRVDSTSFNPQKLKYRMIEAGLMVEECNRCGFHEMRVLDSKLPLLLHFKDNNSNHWGLDNVQLLCYNCYFLFYGQVFSDKEIDQLESTNTTQKTDMEAMDLDDYQTKRLKELGLHDEDDEDDDPYSIVSRGD